MSVTRLTCGLIGYGAWDCHHARAITVEPRASLTAIAARSEASRERARQDQPSAKVFADYRHLLKRNNLDAVVGESSRQRWDLSKAERLLGYRPTIRLEQLGYQFGDEREPF